MKVNIPRSFKNKNNPQSNNFKFAQICLILRNNCNFLEMYFHSIFFFTPQSSQVGKRVKN